MRTLVIGVGNLLLGDEGLGVHAARALLTGCDPPAFDVVDAGTSLFEVIGAAKGYDRLIILDAIRAGGEPGTLYRMETADIEACLEWEVATFSLHEWGIADSLRAARLTGILPPHIVILGAEPAMIEPRLTLSPPAQGAVKRILCLLSAELLDPRNPRDPNDPTPASPLRLPPNFHTIDNTS